MNRSSAHRWASRPFPPCSPLLSPGVEHVLPQLGAPTGPGWARQLRATRVPQRGGLISRSVRQMAGLLMVASSSPDTRATLLVTQDGPGFDLDHVDRLSQRRSPCRARRGPPARGHTLITDACGLPRPDLPWNGDLPAGINLLPGLLRTACTQPDWAGGSSSPPLELGEASPAPRGAHGRTRGPSAHLATRRGRWGPPPDSCRAVWRYHVSAIRRSRSHRLVAKDTTLSRWRHGFESRWDCQLWSVLIWPSSTTSSSSTGFGHRHTGPIGNS